MGRSLGLVGSGGCNCLEPGRQCVGNVWWCIGLEGVPVVPYDFRSRHCRGGEESLGVSFAMHPMDCLLKGCLAGCSGLAMGGVPGLLCMVLCSREVSRHSRPHTIYARFENGCAVKACS